MPLKLEFTPDEYVSELDRQTKMAQALAAGINDSSLNWQPNSGKSWSVLQCLDHLAMMNGKYVKAMQDAVSNNRDQLEPRKGLIQPSGWLTRWFIGTEEPPPTIQTSGPEEDPTAVEADGDRGGRILRLAKATCRLRA